MLKINIGNLKLLRTLYVIIYYMTVTLENISIDCALFGFEEGELKLLLIKRDKQPAMGEWSLPGGYIYMEEDISDSANRVLMELTGIKDLFLSQVKIFGSPDRYPISRVVSTLYCALIKPEQFELITGSHAKEAKWFNIQSIKKLPFDHNNMVKTALTWLQDAIWREPILKNLLPEKFPLNQMQELFEIILQQKFDNRNFRKKVISQELVTKLNEKTKGGQQRPAFLYKLKK